MSDAVLTYDNLFSGNVMPIITEKVTLKSGAVYLRGSVVGLGTTGIAELVDSAKSGGVKEPYGIVATTVDATTENTLAALYMTGEFNPAALTFGGSDAAATHKTALRKLGIFLKETMRA